MAQQTQKLVFTPLFFRALFLHPFTLGDVPNGFQNTNGPVVAADTLEPGGDDYFPAILGSVTDFTLLSTQALQNCLDLGTRNWENGVEQVVNPVADHRAFREAIKLFCSPVPTLDSALKLPDDDRVE